MDWQVDILVQGFPGKTVCHGSLGWSSVALLRGAERVVLVDVGSFNVRKLLLDRLQALGLGPEDVTDVLLSHAHWDHMVNWPMFPRARIVIGAQELEWSLSAPRGRTPVPELYVEQLALSPSLARVAAGEEVLPGIEALAAPGHTPGHLIYVAHGTAHDFVFTGDAAKNRAELLDRKAHLAMDAAQARGSIEAIWRLWSERPGSILVPGHDLPLVQDATHPHGLRYLAEREAAVECWLDPSLEQITTFQLRNPPDIRA